MTWKGDRLLTRCCSVYSRSRRPKIDRMNVAGAEIAQQVVDVLDRVVLIGAVGKVQGRQRLVGVQVDEGQPTLGGSKRRRPGRHRQCCRDGGGDAPAQKAPTVAIPIGRQRSSMSPSCHQPVAACERRCASSTLMRRARRGIHHERLWLRAMNRRYRRLSKSHGTLSLDHRIDDRNLTDISAGVKRIVPEKPTGASGAPVDDDRKRQAGC